MPERPVPVPVGLAGEQVGEVAPLAGRHGDHAELPYHPAAPGAASPGPGPAARRRPADHPGLAKVLLDTDRLAGGVQGHHPLQLGAGGQGWRHEGDPGHGLAAAEGRHPHRGPAGQLEPDAGHLLAGQPRQQQPGAGPPRQAVPLGDDAAVAVLPDGRVVSGGGEFDGRVLVWDPSQPGTDPVELGRHDGRVHAVAVLADGRVVSGGRFGGVLVWDPSRPGSDPLELGHDSVIAVAVLPDGRVVSGGYDRRVLIWNATTQRQVAQMDCSVVGLAAVQASRSEASLVVVHEGHGFSLWSVERTTMSRAE
jgi:hypothetical protein